jgi:DNA/RNA-binding domain of Phe-tRNA-synthetase-like protein
MHFLHQPEVWRQFPQLVAGVLTVEGIQRLRVSEAELVPWLERARSRLAGRTESELPEVAAWRRVYAQMGLKPTQYRSAAEALLRRFRREDSLPRLHPLVDLCNALSLAWGLPVAVFDLAEVDGFLEVRRAQGSERYLAFGGEEERPAAGEIIFADASGNVHARRWTFRQSRLSAVRPATQRVLVVSEGVHPTAAADVPALLAALRERTAALGAEPGRPVLLSAREPRVEF